MSQAWDRQIAQALESVPDPCSVAAGAPLSVSDMGLVRGWTVSADGDLEVRLDVTSPLCLMAGHFVADAQRRLNAIEGLRTVVVKVDPSGLWSTDNISRRGRARLDARRRRVQDAH
jgi:metal-sulfur cluster biosynthetic enzyme